MRWQKSCMWALCPMSRLSVMSMPSRVPNGRQTFCCGLWQSIGQQPSPSPWVLLLGGLQGVCCIQSMHHSRKHLNRVHLRQIRFRVFSGNRAYQIRGYAGSGPLAVILCDNGSSAAVGAELEANSYERPLCHHYHNLVPVRYAIGIVHVLYATRTASRRARRGSQGRILVP